MALEQLLQTHCLQEAWHLETPVVGDCSLKHQSMELPHMVVECFWEVHHQEACQQKVVSYQEEDHQEVVSYQEEDHQEEDYQEEDHQEEDYQEEDHQEADRQEEAHQEGHLAVEDFLHSEIHGILTEISM